MPKINVFSVYARRRFPQWARGRRGRQVDLFRCFSGIAYVVFQALRFLRTAPWLRRDALPADGG